MLIDSVQIYRVAMPLIQPWRTAYGEDATVETILVRISGGGAFGWGESCPLAAPCYSPEWAAGAFNCVRDWLAPAIVGQTVDSGAALQELLAHFKGNPFAKATLDTAWWSLESELRQAPLYKLLGGARNRVDVGADFGVLDSIPELLAEVGKAVAAGFKRIKLKFRPGWDLSMLAAVRQEFPTQAIHIDCNSAYSLEDLDLFRRIEEFNLAMIEQPLAHDDLYDHARLQVAIRTPICLDESINSVRRARQAVEMRSCQWLNIKPARVGGLTPALEIHNLCQAAGIGCWVGGMLESALGVRICAALATLENFTYPADIFPTARFYKQDVCQPEVILTGGQDGPQVICPDAAGIGAAPHPQRLKAQTIEEAVVGKG